MMVVLLELEGNADLLKEFGAMTENLKAMQTRLTDSETQITDLRNKGKSQRIKYFIGEFIKFFCAE